MPGPTYSAYRVSRFQDCVLERSSTASELQYLDWADDAVPLAIDYGLNGGSILTVEKWHRLTSHVHSSHLLMRRTRSIAGSNPFHADLRCFGDFIPLERHPVHAAWRSRRKPRSLNYSPSDFLPRSREFGRLLANLGESWTVPRLNTLTKVTRTTFPLFIAGITCMKATVRFRIV